MITVKGVYGEELALLYKEAKKEINEFSGAVVAKDGENSCGYCLFEIKDGKMTITEIDPSINLSMADGVLRSALHIAVCRNITDAFYSCNEEIMEKLCFIENKQEKRLKISKLFESCCCNKN